MLEKFDIMQSSKFINYQLFQSHIKHKGII